jgi:hypothetical protein
MKSNLTFLSLLIIVVPIGLTACQSQTSELSQASTDSGGASNTEMCGTVIQKSAKIYLQSISGNSEENADYLLEPQDGATTQVLEDLAQRAGNACITARFVASSDSVMITTVANIRETN